MKIFYFVRHGEADFNLLDRVNAHPNVKNDLTITGREQATCCATSLQNALLEIIYCSEFPRARQTAEILNELRRLPILVDSQINETGAFAYEGKPTQLWRSAQMPDRVSAVLPGCEPFFDMKQRLMVFLEKLKQGSQQGILIVSHEEPIQIMLGILGGIPDVVALQRPISHCFPVAIEIERGAT